MEQEILKELVTIKSILMGLTLSLFILAMILLFEWLFPSRINSKPETFRSTCNRYFEKGAFEKLISFCEKEIHKNERSPLAYWWLGRAYFALEDMESSEKAFYRCLEIDPLYEKDHVAPFLKRIKESH